MWCAAAWARHPAESAPLSDAEALALAEDASLDLGGVALGDDAWSLASGKNVSLYCNGKKVTPEEDATLLGSNKTKVLVGLCGPLYCRLGVMCVVIQHTSCHVTRSFEWRRKY